MIIGDEEMVVDRWKRYFEERSWKAGRRGNVWENG